MKKLLIVTASLLGLAGACRAETQGSVALGVGVASCEHIIDLMGDAPSPSSSNYNFGVMSWIQGYFSGFNTALEVNKDPTYIDLESSDPLKIWGDFIDYCKKHPKVTGDTAALHILSNMTMRKR